MDYGHPKEVMLSKNIWKNGALTCIEGIYWGSDSLMTQFYSKTDKEIKIKKLPNEYKKIPNSDWFEFD